MEVLWNDPRLRRPAEHAVTSSVFASRPPEDASNSSGKVPKITEIIYKH
jgi:hypothetical protein